jgi:crotonobetainyl-CoA:carnitine CoA-transferase CaiB-like acyl-CoA transferase
VTRSRLEVRDRFAAAAVIGVPMDGAGIRPLAEELGVPADRVEVDPVDDLFGSPFRVTEAAVTSVGAALAAVAAFDEQRTGRPSRAFLDGRHAAAAFHSERLVRLIARGEQDLWDPIAGNYPTAAGWIRLHTNLPHHRDPLLRVLGVEPERAAVAAAVARWHADELESAVVEAGGVAARMRGREEYLSHPQRAAVLARPVVDLETEPVGGARTRGLGQGEVLDGVRVLDLSRVIAGPVAGRFLTSFGADVIRVDPPLEDGLLLEIETGFGKRRTEVYPSL